MREAKAGPWWPQAVGYAGITLVAVGCATVVRIATGRVNGARAAVVGRSGRRSTAPTPTGLAGPSRQPG